MNSILDNDIVKIILKKNLFKRYTMLLISLFLSSILYNLFILPANIVTGGVGGVGVITKYLYNFDPSIIIFVLSVALLIFSIMYLDIEKTSAAVVGTIAYPLFVQLTSSIGNYITIDTGDFLLISIFIGVIGGFCGGIMYKTGFTAGGLPIISQILYKYFNISIGTSSLIINGIVVVIGGFFFGWTMVMYALIILFINSQIIDRVMIGVSKNKAFYIITSEYEKVNDYIINVLQHSVTIFDVKGGFLEKKRKVLLAVVPTTKYFKLTEGIKLIDKEAFFLASDAYQVKGGK